MDGLITEFLIYLILVSFQLNLYEIHTHVYIMYVYVHIYISTIYMYVYKEGTLSCKLKNQYIIVGICTYFTKRKFLTIP